METPLSVDEREALSRFISRIITDVDKVADLFEKRGIDASGPKAARADLQSTLQSISLEESIGDRIHAQVPDY